MRVLWIQQYFGSPGGWGSQRQYAFAKRWVSAGHEVEVVCTAAYDASLLGAGGALEGVRLHLSRASYRPQMGFLRRCLSFLRFMLDALWLVTRHGRRYDVLIASSGPLTNLVPALWGRLLHGLPYVFEVLDVWPDAAVEAGVLRSRVLVGCCRGLEAAGYRWASRIVTCSEGMTARVHAKLCGARGPDLTVSAPYRECLRGAAAAGGRVATIAHGAELAVPDREACRRRLLESCGWDPDVCVVLYMGALGLSNATEDLVDAMRQTAGTSGLVWVFAGGGACEGEIREQLARTPGAFLGTLSHAQMDEVCAAADINVVTFMHAPLYFENSPNKFFDGAAAGLPAVFNRSTWLEPLLDRYGCGVVCGGPQPGRAMAEALIQLSRDPGRRRAMGEGARRLAEEVFNRDRLAADYWALVSGAAQDGRAR